MNRHDDRLSEEELAEFVTDGVVDFLEALFADRVLLWRRRGFGGRWRVGFRAEDVAGLSSDTEVFVWTHRIR